MIRHKKCTAPARGITFALAGLFGVSGCDLSEPYQNPTFGFLSKYTTARTASPVLLDNTAWWQGLKDPTLDHLITLALRDNISLEIARERVTAARVARNGVPELLIVSPTAEVTLSGSNRIDRSSTASTALGLSWMLDPYGTRRAQLRAAEARIEVADAEEDAARLLVLFNMANAYASLRQSQQTLVQSHKELKRRQDTLALTSTLREAQSATRLETTRSRARVAEIRAELPAQKAAVTANLNAIAVLAGVTPGGLGPDVQAALVHSAAQPQPQLTPDVGIPADLLRNRPDIRIAERSYYAAVEDIGIARAALYPRLSLTGAITLNALGGRSSDVDYFLGPAVEFPILPTTQARAGVQARHSAARQAHAEWRSTVLEAILEVENALVTYRAASTALTSAHKARQLYRETLNLTREVFENGEATLGDLIDAEQALSEADQTVIDLRTQHTLRFIELNVSLGAGHDTHSAPR